MKRLIDFLNSNCVSVTFGKSRENNSIDMTLADETGTRPSMFSSRTVSAGKITEDFVVDAVSAMLCELDERAEITSGASILADAEQAWNAQSILPREDCAPDGSQERFMLRGGFLQSVLAISNRLYEKAIAALKQQHQTTGSLPVITARLSTPGVTIIGLGAPAPVSPLRTALAGNLAASSPGAIPPPSRERPNFARF